MTLPTQPSPRVAALLAKMRSNHGRLIFALDATGSRERTWDMATQLQAQMFDEAARIGGLDVQLIYYRGDEVRKSSWLADARELVSQMRTIKCVAGATKITRVLRHIKTENDRETVNAVVFVGDAIEELPTELYAAATDLGVPLFMFQEGDDAEVIFYNQHGEVSMASPPQKVEHVFREIARLTGGAYGKFDAGSAKQLGELLRAVAAFAVGGMTALAGQNSDSARKLLGQMK